MINISPTEKQLAAMTPPQRKQYVQMHKSNPYIVSMALNIDNLEKAIRSADQARNSPDEQPKVVDQFLAQMGTPSQPQMAQAQEQPCRKTWVLALSQHPTCRAWPKAASWRLVTAATCSGLPE